VQLNRTAPAESLPYFNKVSNARSHTAPALPSTELEELPPPPRASANLAVRSASAEPLLPRLNELRVPVGAGLTCGEVKESLSEKLPPPQPEPGPMPSCSLPSCADTTREALAVSGAGPARATTCVARARVSSGHRLWHGGGRREAWHSRRQREDMPPGVDGAEASACLVLEGLLARMQHRERGADLLRVEPPDEVGMAQDALDGQPVLRPLHEHLREWQRREGLARVSEGLGQASGGGKRVAG
jgi:hypothetical protein